MTNAIIQKSALAAGDIEKINRYTRRELTEDELYIFTVKLCNNDIDRDYEKFSVEALRQMAELFVGKTCIEDHSMKASNQRARIFDTYIEVDNEKTTADGEALHNLMGKAYMLKNDRNKEFIDEIDAGIKKEVSVSCSMKKSVCSVCGKDRHKEHCGHINGREYNGRLCYTVLSKATDAYELSFVAVPAQRDAGVTKSFKVKEDFNMQSIEKLFENCTDGLSLTKSQANELAEYITDLKEQASLGAEYKKQLAADVTKKLCASLPQLDFNMLSSIVAVMTTKELLEFKKGLSTSTGTPAPQLMKTNNQRQTKNLSEFKI